MKPQRASLAVIGMAEMERKAVISAIGTTSATVGAEYTWTEPTESEILIVDVTNGEAAAMAMGLAQQQNPVIIRYAGRDLGLPVEITRPIRVQTLIEVMRGALNVAAERAATRAAMSRTGRFAAFKADAPVPPQATEVAPSAKPVRTYRGASY